MYIARLLHYVESIYTFMWACEPTSNLRTRHGNNGRTIARAHTRIQAVNPSTNLHIRYANRERRQRVYSQYTNTYIHTYRELVSVRKVPLRWNEEGKSSSRLGVRRPRRPHHSALPSAMRMRRRQFGLRALCNAARSTGVGRRNAALYHSAAMSMAMHRIGSCFAVRRSTFLHHRRRLFAHRHRSQVQ